MTGLLPIRWLHIIVSAVLKAAGNNQGKENMATISEQVATIAAAFAAYEEAIIAMKKTDVRGLLAQLYAERKIGFLEYQTKSAMFESMISGHEADTYGMHSALTKRAIELGIDLPQPKGGGDR